MYIYCVQTYLYNVGAFNKYSPNVEKILIYS